MKIVHCKRKVETPTVDTLSTMVLMARLDGQLFNLGPTTIIQVQNVGDFTIACRNHYLYSLSSKLTLEVPN